MDNDIFIFKSDNNNRLFNYDYLNELLLKMRHGLSEKQTIYLLKWIVSRIKHFLDKKDNVITPTYKCLCGYAADLAVSLLSYLKINCHEYNIRKMINYPINIHAITLVKFPGIDNHDVEYIIDPTFRQFLIKEECTPPHYKFFDNNSCMTVGGYPGYYLSLTKDGTEFGTKLLNDGFFKSTEDNWKLYGDAFMQYRNYTTFSGYHTEELLSGFEYYNRIFECEHKAENYTDIKKLPSELKI